MTGEIHVDEKLIEAFHLMYDHYPEPATLVHKTKRVVAVNPPCAAIGREVGMNCAKHGPAEAHKGCLAAKAVKEQKAQWKMSGTLMPWGREYVVFWLPVHGYPDFYIHFGVGTKIDFAAPLAE